MTGNTSPSKSESNILHGKLHEMIDMMSMHIATTKTQIDIKDDIEQIIAEEVKIMLQHDFHSSLIQIKSTSDEREQQVKFNWLIIDLAK